MTQFFNSLVACWDGPRGGGKTLAMTADACAKLLSGQKVWSNYPIKFISDYGQWPGVWKEYKSEPIDMDSIYTMASSIRGGWVYIDEAYLWSNSRRSQSLANILINGEMAMIRKRKLSFGLTTQQFEWLDKQLRFQTDVLTSCFDLHFKYPKLPPGTMIALDIKDLSGRLTGFSFHKTGKVIQKQLSAQGFWKCYSTDQEFDVLAARRSIKMTGGARMLRASADGGSYITDDDQQKSHLANMVGEVLADFKNRGQLSPLRDELIPAIENKGIKGPNQIGRILRQLGATRHDVSRPENAYYDISKYGENETD